VLHCAVGLKSELFGVVGESVNAELSLPACEQMHFVMKRENRLVPSGTYLLPGNHNAEPELIQSCVRSSLARGRLSGLTDSKLSTNPRPFRLIFCSARLSDGNLTNPLAYCIRCSWSRKRICAVKICIRITPRDQISTENVYESKCVASDSTRPRTSGGAKAGVPALVLKAPEPSAARLVIPKSAILTHQSGPRCLTSIFYGDVSIQNQDSKSKRRLTAGFKSL